MELTQKIKEIEGKVVRNELKEALELIQLYSEEDKLENIRNEVITHLSNLKNLQQLKRSNQLEDEKYLKQKSKISAAILTLKDQYAYFVENPDAVPESAPSDSMFTSTLPNNVVNPNQVQLLQIPHQNSMDWFKKVLLLLFAVFGGAVLYFIFTAQIFQTVSTGSMLGALWGAKIYDDNSKFRLQKLLLEQNNLAQKQS